MRTKLPCVQRAVGECSECGANYYPMEFRDGYHCRHNRGCMDLPDSQLVLPTIRWYDEEAIKCLTTI